MSRLAKHPIKIPPKTEVTVSDGTVRVKGPKGSLARASDRHVTIEVVPEGVVVRGAPFAPTAMVGTWASHVRNMLRGVTEGFTKRLVIEGVGYKWDVVGENLNLSLGFSHPVVLPIPKGLSVSSEKGVLTVSGTNPELVGQFAAEVRAQKPPEPYKGKGIRYEDEIIRRKQGKRAV